jgi:hypothetical protein
MTVVSSQHNTTMHACVHLCPTPARGRDALIPRLLLTCFSQPTPPTTTTAPPPRRSHDRRPCPHAGAPRPPGPADCQVSACLSLSTLYRVGGASISAWQHHHCSPGLVGCAPCLFFIGWVAAAVPVISLKHSTACSVDAMQAHDGRRRPPPPLRLRGERARPSPTHQSPLPSCFPPMLFFFPPP